MLKIKIFSTASDLPNIAWAAFVDAIVAKMHSSIINSTSITHIFNGCKSN